MSTRLTRGLTLLGAAALCAACSKSDKTADTTAVHDTTTVNSTATTPGTAAATTPAPAALNDTTILGTLDELNAADSAGGKLASTKGTNAAVKSFGKDMMRDHHKLRASGQALAKKLNITPAPPPGDTTQTSAQTFSDSLNAMPKGAAWDKAYIDHEVAVHQAVLSFLQSAQTAATDTTLKAAITKATPVIQGHLTNAQGIQTKLNAAKP